jgi:hypothetical protein
LSALLLTGAGGGSGFPRESPVAAFSEFSGAVCLSSFSVADEIQIFGGEVSRKWLNPKEKIFFRKVN